MVLCVGILVLIFRKRTIAFSWKRIFGVSILAAFNKGISGGGYGPLIVSGQILSGNKATNAIGITSMAEGMICAVGFTVYAILNKGFANDLCFAIPIFFGAVIAAPIAAWTTKKISSRMNMKTVIGISTCILGAWTLWNVFR